MVARGFADLLAFPILGAGIWTGSQRFASADQKNFRRGIVLLLTVLSVLNIVRVL